MKRFYAVLITLSLICTVAFAETFFSKSRFLEVKAGASFGLSNNVLAAPDFMKKDLVIDLRKMADDCPDTGFDILANVHPEAAINVHIKSLSVGFSTGVEFYEKLNIDKGLFNFLGYGNQIGQTVTASLINNMELFAYAQVDVGFNVKKFKLHVQPAIFVPLAEIRDSGGIATARNDASGNLNIHANMNMEVYTPLELSFDEEGRIKINTDGIERSLFTGYGFDVSANMSVPLGKLCVIEADARVPLIPGRIKKKYTVTGDFAFDSPVLKIGENDFVTNKPQANGPFEADLAINRPLKAHAYISKSFFMNMFELRGGGGLCLRRPFQENSMFYPEYYIGFGINLFSIVKFNASTQYVDQIYIHQLGSTINLRIVQLDLGASLQSADFKKSFAFSGFGAYAYVTVGF